VSSRDVVRLIAAAPEMTTPDTWPDPDMRLVEDDRPAPPALDDEALPAGWSGWIAAEAEARGCPRDYVAAGLIAAASAWIGNARHAGATASWSEPPHVWLALIGPPSPGAAADRRGLPRDRARGETRLAGGRRRACEPRRGRARYRGGLAAAGPCRH
jgi:hypothetical protein